MNFLGDRGSKSFRTLMKDSAPQSVKEEEETKADLRSQIVDYEEQEEEKEQVPIDLDDPKNIKETLQQLNLQFRMYKRQINAQPDP